MSDLDDDVDLFADPYDDEEVIRPRRTSQRIIAAVLLLALVALLVAEPSRSIWRRTTGRSEAPAADGPTDATLAEHPGASASDGDWSLQVGASVLIGTTEPNCAGSITILDGRRYITSARHCLEELLDDGDVPADAAAVAEITDLLSRPVNVFDPVSHRTLATLDRIVVGGGATDLLVATTTDESAAFADRPARRVDRAPAVGDEVVTYASSGADDFRPRRLTGVYLGVFGFDDPTGLGHTVDLIGYRQPASATLIGAGHSGHSSTGAGGTAFGPVLFSINGDTPGPQRLEDLREMGAATGLDLAAEGLVAIDQALHLVPADYARLEAHLR